MEWHVKGTEMEIAYSGILLNNFRQYIIGFILTVQAFCGSSFDSAVHWYIVIYTCTMNFD